MKRRKWAVLFLLGLIAVPAWALPFRAGRVIMPPDTRLTLPPGAYLKKHSVREEWVLYLPPSAVFPFVIRATGPMGGFTDREIRSPADLLPLTIAEDVIKDKNPNPQVLAHLPSLCPRLGRDAAGRRVYDARYDRLNHIPVLQLLDPDLNSGVQYKSYAEMDGKNALLVRSIRLRRDYEDDRILDYEGPHPITGQSHTVMEGQGGFYANLHYAVLPYSRKVPKMDRQLLLHLAQGKLKEINREELRPELRTHSFLPGPFLSRTGYLYDLCEWGDTAHQAPEQTVVYRDLAVWDWDYSVARAERVLLVVWEGDEEDWLIQDKLIDPFYLTDDVVGVFEIRRKDTLKPLTLRNEAGDFEITVQTGSLEVLP